jgi:uncharacterized membrane protein
MDKQHQKEKVHFQIERIAFFSDAVIAIAVTLLIIEIKAPHIKIGTTLSEQVEELKHLVPEFVSFIISFAVIIAQWRKHHEIFGRVINYDRKLISLNSLFLFAIAIIPFSTSYFAHNTAIEFYFPILVYGLNLIFLTTLNYLIFSHITGEEHKLFDHSLTEMELMWTKVDYLLFPVALATGLLVGFIDYSLGFVAYVMVLTGGSVLNKRRNRVTV